MAQQKFVTFSPTSASSSSSHLHYGHKLHSSHQLSYNGHHHTAESGYASGFSSSRPFDTTSRDASLANCSSLHGSSMGDAQTTPRTTAAINYMSNLQLSTPRLRSNRKGTPLKRNQTPCSILNHSMTYETTPKKSKGHENIENETSYVSMSRSAGKVPFRARLDRSLSHPLSPLLGGVADKLDCTFDAISSSTPICQPFRAEFYEHHVEEIPLKNLPRSGGKNTRTKLIRKMQSFSPRKLMGLRATKIPLREMDQNSVDFNYAGELFTVEEEESPIAKINSGGMSVKKALFSDPGVVPSGGAFSTGLRDLMFGTIKIDGMVEEPKTEETKSLSSTENERKTSTHHNQETSSQLLDLYVSNLSNLDGGDSNSHPATEDGDVSMNTSMVADVERYFDELKRNTTQAQEEPALENFSPLKPKNSLGLYDMLEGIEGADAPPENNNCSDKIMEIEQAPLESAAIVDEVPAPVKQQPPQLLRKRKRPSTELIQAVLATPKKMRRSQSFAIGDQPPMTDENVEQPSEVHTDLSYPIHFVSPGQQRLGGARKRLNYEPVARNRLSPAKRHLTFDGAVKRRSLNGTARLNIFRHLASCPPVCDYFFDFVEDKDLASIYAVSRQCRAMIEGNNKLNGRRLEYLKTAWRKKENNETMFTSSSSLIEEPVLRSMQTIARVPLHNRNVDTSVASSINETMSPPVSPSRRRFHQNQKLVQQNPGATFVPCPRCRSCSVIEQQQEPEFSPRTENSRRMSQRGIGDSFNNSSTIAQRFSMRNQSRSQSMCVSELGSRNTSLMIPVRKQMSLPERDVLRSAADLNGGDHRVGICQSVQCGFRFCAHCSYAFETGHKCVEIGTLSPLIKQSRQPRVVACSKQSKRNLKRL